MENEEKIYYAVMRLNHQVSITNPIGGEAVEINLVGCAGYIPVYDNHEEAIESSENGKYQILTIQSS